MKNHINYRIVLFLVIMLMLLPFSSCRIMQKTKTETKETVDLLLHQEVDSKVYQDIETEIQREFKSETESITKKFSEMFQIDYTPLFDQNGNIIPLIYKHTINGQTEEIYFSGANFQQSYTNAVEDKKATEQLTEKIRTKIITNYQTVTTYLSHTTYKSKYKEAEKQTIAFDFSFWIYFGFGLFVLILGLVFIYKKKWKPFSIL